MKNAFIALVLVSCVLVAVFPAFAGDSVFSEVRGGAYIHDIDFWSFDREDGTDVNAELLFVSPDCLDVLWSPRPHLGVTVNTDGNTSHAYTGLTWEYDIFGDFFVDGSLGLSVHNGHLDTDNRDRKSLGSPVLFRIGAALGYNLTEKVNLSIQYEHMSNAYLANENEGMDNVGLRLGYRF